MHLDGDYLAYYASGNDETPPGEARMIATNIITSLRNKSGAEKVVVHSSHKAGTKGERYIIATVKPYQGQRVGGRKPVNHEYLQDWIQTYEGPLFRSKVWATREADDGIAYMAQWHNDYDPLGYCVIATADKDMQMLPGLHIRWKEHDLVRVTQSDFCIEHSYRHLKAGEAVDGIKIYGTKWFWLQMLMGDAADNIPGLEKWVEYDGKQKPVGEKTAAMILQPCEDDQSALDTVWDHYVRYYGVQGPDRFCEQAALLWLRRDRDADVGDFYEWFLQVMVEVPKQLPTAVNRLKERVERGRATLNQIAS